MTSIVTFMLALLVAVPQAAPPPTPQRFDMVVRADFFAGFAGDEARLAKGMATCEEVLAVTPNHAEALVWHGSGLAFNAGKAFQQGDMKTGGDLWQRGMEEMDKAASLEPDNVGVRIPRGALLPRCLTRTSSGDRRSSDLGAPGQGGAPR